jgi:hypothetical protein
MALRGHAGARGPFPGRDGRGARLAFVLRVPVVTARHEQIRKLPMNRGESLKLARRFEAAHHLLVHPCGLVRILRPVVQSFVLPMLDFSPGSLFADPSLRSLSVTITRGLS